MKKQTTTTTKAITKSTKEGRNKTMKKAQAQAQKKASKVSALQSNISQTMTAEEVKKAKAKARQKAEEVTLLSACQKAVGTVFSRKARLDVKRSEMFTPSMNNPIFADGVSLAYNAILKAKADGHFWKREKEGGHKWVKVPYSGKGLSAEPKAYKELVKTATGEKRKKDKHGILPEVKVCAESAETWEEVTRFDYMVKAKGEVYKAVLAPAYYAVNAWLHEEGEKVKPVLFSIDSIEPELIDYTLPDGKALESYSNVTKELREGQTEVGKLLEARLTEKEYSLIVATAEGWTTETIIHRLGYLDRVPDHDSEGNALSESARIKTAKDTAITARRRAKEKAQKIIAECLPEYDRKAQKTQK